MENELLNFAQVGQLIGLTRARISAAVKAGLIVAETHGPVKLVRRREALRYQRERKPAGRPHNA